MDQIFWTCVDVNVLLLRGTVSFLIASLIPFSFQKPESEKDAFQDDCEVTVEEHWPHNGVSCLLVPILVEVRLLPIEVLEEEPSSLLSEVGIDQEQ